VPRPELGGCRAQSLLRGQQVADQKDNPGVIARPPRIFLGFLVAGLILDHVWPAAFAAQLFDGGLRFVPALALAVAGIAIMASAMRRFAAAGTNVPTPLPVNAIVTDGLYSYSRNPIYIALTIIYLAIAIAAASTWSLILLIPMFFLIRYGVIAREELYLEGKFGNTYLDYRNRVRRWI
jgi:protein-S-isoprenylcysteine O-methyltransferase Ste14